MENGMKAFNFQNLTKTRNLKNISKLSEYKQFWNFHEIAPSVYAKQSTVRILNLYDRNSPH